MGQAEQIFYGIVCSISAIPILLTFRVILLHRQSPILRKFNPETTVLVFGFYVLCTWVFSIYATLPSASWQQFIASIVPFGGLLFGSFFYLITLYYVQFFLTEQRLELAAALSDEEEASKVAKTEAFIGQSWLAKVVSSTRNSFIFFLTWIILVIIPYYFVIFVAESDVFSEPSSSKISDPKAMGAIVIVIVAQAILFAGPITYFYRRIRKTRQDRGIQKVVGMLAINVVYISICGVLFVATPLGDLAAQKFDFRPFLQWHMPVLLSLVYFWWSTYPKLVQSIENSRAESSENTPGYKTEMKKVLQDPAANKLFVEQAREEFSVENVLFWNAVQFMKQCKSGSKKMEIARKIVELHIQPKSACEVNISHKARQAILLAIKSQDLEEASVDTIFDDAVNEIELLLLNQTFINFKKQRPSSLKRKPSRIQNLEVAPVKASIEQ